MDASILQHNSPTKSLPGVRIGRPPAVAPTPGKRSKNGYWSLFWRDKKKLREIGLGHVGEPDAEAARLEIALALRTGNWPDWAAARNLPTRWGLTSSHGDLLTEYSSHIFAELEYGWAKSSRSHIRKLHKWADKPLELITAADAQRYLDHILTSGRAEGTRNRCLAACRRFYDWLIIQGRVARNPFAGVHMLKEPDIEHIVHLSITERDQVIRAAAGHPDELAIWIALYLGMRRSEIARATWDDVDLERKKFIVPKSKNHKRRTIDMANDIQQRLGAVPRSQRTGRILAWPVEREPWIGCSERLVLHLREALPRLAKKLNWTPFRHTFASMLAQQGAPIFKIAYWMGNSVAVCSKHYASMMPDADPDIEKLNAK